MLSIMIESITESRTVHMSFTVFHYLIQLVVQSPGLE